MAPSQMQAVLWDMMRADQFLADYVLNKDTSFKKDEKRFNMYHQVFAIHKIDKEIYQRSLNYYLDHPDLLKVILDSISKPKLAPAIESIESKVILDSVVINDSIPHKPDTLVRDTPSIPVIEKISPLEKKLFR